MSVKDEVLKELENNKGDYISGGQLADNLGVSRNSVWKAIKALEKSGYEINAIPRVIALQKKMIFYLHTVLNNI